MFKQADSALSNQLSILITGKSGIGKTALAGTFSDPSEVCLINLENGFRTISHLPIAIYDCCVDANGNEMPRHMRHKKLIHALKEVFSRDDAKKKFKYLVIDSLTEASQNLIEALKLQYPDPKNTLQMYGENNVQMSDLVKTIRDLPYVTVVLALESADKDEVGRRYYTSDVAGKISSRLPAFFDEVFFYDMFEKNGKKDRFLLTQSYETYVAKDRSGKLEMLEAPNMQNIINKILGKEKKDVKSNASTSSK